jgi:aminotransferase
MSGQYNQSINGGVMQEVTNVSRLSKRVAGLKPSGIRKFFDIAATMKDVISLGIGEPDFTTPKPILEAGIRSLQNGETHYTSNWGRLELRQAIADNLMRLYHVKYDPSSEIIATVGVSEALYLTFTAILDPGDEVIIPTPCFVSYQAEVIMSGGVPVEVIAREENNFMVDPADIRKAITPRTRCIFIGYPSNPTGAVATREVMLEIAKIAEEHDLLVVSDEIYDRLVYDFEHVCFPSLDESLKNRTILLGGFSKDYAMTGWRIGYACGPSDLIQGLVRIHQYTIMSAPTTAQDAALEALKSGNPTCRKCLRNMTAAADCSWRDSTASACGPSSRAARSTLFPTSGPPAWTTRPSPRNYCARSMWPSCRAMPSVPAETGSRACAMPPNTARSRKPCTAWRSS